MSDIQPTLNAIDETGRIVNCPVCSRPVQTITRGRTHVDGPIQPTTHGPCGCQTGSRLLGTPTHLSIGGVDVTGYVSSIDLSSTYAEPNSQVWEIFLQGLEPVTFTMSFDASADPFAAYWNWAARVKRRRMSYLHSSYRRRVLSRARRSR